MKRTRSAKPSVSPIWRRQLVAVIGLTAVLVIGPGALADVVEQSRNYCQAKFSNLPKSSARCVKSQVKAANQVGDELARYGSGSEERRIFSHCAESAKVKSGGHDWPQVKYCFTAERKAYQGFNQARAAASGDTFTSKIFGFCRAKQRPRNRDHAWREAERCRGGQTQAGNAVAAHYRAHAAGTLTRKAVDSCAAEHRTTEGYYNWSAVKRCIESYLR